MLVGSRDGGFVFGVFVCKLHVVRVLWLRKYILPAETPLPYVFA